MRHAFVLLLVCGVSGCAMRRDLVAENDVTLQTDAGPNSVMVGPHVVQAGNELQVTGAVMRKTGNETPMSGHVEIVETDSTGKVLDQFSASLQPRSIPTTGDRSSNFEVTELATVQKGAMIKATFVDELHPTIDYFAGMTSEPGGMSEGHGGGGGSGGGGRGHSHSGGGIGMHLQGSPHGGAGGGHGGGRH